MNNVLNDNNKSDYYIGMSIPSRPSEFTPNVVVSSETILDYDEYNPPPRQKPSATPKRKRRTHNGGSSSGSGRHVFDIKEEEEEDSASEEEEFTSDHESNEEHDDDDDDEDDEEDEDEEDDDILENDEYAYDDDSDDMKHHINNINNNHVSSNKTHTTYHSNNNSGHVSTSNNIIDEDSEYTQIQALQEQLQQQQRQLILQSHQLKELKHQIKNQNDSDSINMNNMNMNNNMPPPQNNMNMNMNMNMNNIPPNNMNMTPPIPPIPSGPPPPPTASLTPYHFDDEQQHAHQQYLNNNHAQMAQMTQMNQVQQLPQIPTHNQVQQVQGQFSSDSDDALTNSPFPTLTFDDEPPPHTNNTQTFPHPHQQSNPNVNNMNAMNNMNTMNNMNPNLSLPHNTNRTIHSVEHGSFRQKQVARSPRTPKLKNPFSRNNSRNGNISSATSPRKQMQPLQQSHQQLQKLEAHEINEINEINNRNNIHQQQMHLQQMQQIQQRQQIQPPNAFNNMNNVNNMNNTPYKPITQIHKRTNSNSSHKSSRSIKSNKKKRSKKKNRSDPNANVNVNINNNTKIPHLIESPIANNISPKSSHHSSKSKRRSNKSKSHSHHSSINQPKSPRKKPSKPQKQSSGNLKRNSNKKDRKNSGHSHKSYKSLKSSMDRESLPLQAQLVPVAVAVPTQPIIDHNQKLNRKQLNMNYGTVNEQIQTNLPNNNNNLNVIPSPRSDIHSPPISIGNSPPLSPNSKHGAHAHMDDEYSDDGHSEHSYSNGTTGQQHKLSDIALPSTYYTSECGDQHKIITNGSGNVVDLFMDPLQEIEFTADNLELHNKKLEAKRQQQSKYQKLSNKQKREPYHLAHYHQHQHQHLHHHHYHQVHGQNQGTAVDIVNGDGDGNGSNNNNMQLNMNQFSGLSVASTESQVMQRIFHPTNRMRSMFQDKNKLKNKPNLPINPESQYSTAAALDPLDELDNMDVLNNYDKHKELGNGTDAFVYEVVDRRDKSHVAMKLTKRKSGRYKTEIHLLHQLKTCPYVVKLLNCLENDNVYVLILEHAPMSLENLLLQRCTKHPMQERVAKTILSQILKGIRAIHNLGFVHKDIKPENILIFANRSERKLIAKVADFGFATRVAPGDNMISIDQLPREKYIEFEKHVRDRCGTPGFWPPELVTSLCHLKHAFKMDVFSAGVTLYRMLCNEMPFGIFESWKYNIDHRDGQKKLCKVKPNWKVISWIQSDNKYTPVLSSRKLSDTVKDLLRSMLRIRPEQRAMVDACLAHAFFNNNKKVKKVNGNGNGNGNNNNHHKKPSNNMGNMQPPPQRQQQQHYRNKSSSNTYSNTATYSNINNTDNKHRKKRSHHSNSNISNRKYARSSNKMKAKG